MSLGTLGVELLNRIRIVVTDYVDIHPVTIKAYLSVTAAS
jgi:hypothetical protein